MIESTMTQTQAFGCQFFSTTPERAFCPEDFSADENLMIQTAEQFMRKEVMTKLDRIDAQEEGLMPSLIRQAGELGFCGIDTPEAYGGLGLSKNLTARMLEFLSLNASFSVTLGVTSGISQVGLVLFGTEEQKRKYLPRLASGEWIGAYCLSEANSGSDALAATTRADLRDGHWVLRGQKMWISNAKWAQSFLVMAKIDGEKFSAFLVERDYPGVVIEREEHKMGLKGSSTARVTLDDVPVPMENLLHQPGKGHHVAFNALNLGRFKLAAMSLGPARDAIGFSAAYAKERKQFGRPIAEFGLIRKKFADMASRFYAAESMLYRTGDLIDQSFDAFGGTVEGNMRAAEDCSVECSACKVFATDVEAFIVDEALQVFGGYGFTEEFPAARQFRDARVSRIYEGTNEINRLFLGGRLRKKSQEGIASLDAVGDSFISELAGKAIRRPTTSQIEDGAISDLVLLAYAEQSARLRSGRLGGIHELAYRHFVNWANLEAAGAYAALTGESMSIPAPQKVDVEEFGAAVIDLARPI